MKNKQTQALILGILFMLVAIGGLLLHKPKEERKITFTPVTTAEETSENTTSAARTSTATSATSFVSTVSTTSTTEITSETVTEFLFLDLNKASADELSMLKGIGEVKAAAIISYREKHGGFSYIEEIMMVDGIGPETFDDIKEHIFVENPVTTVATTEPVTETDTQPEIVITHESKSEGTETESILTLEDIAPVNINTAGKEELMLLPNIDEKTAEGIIELRGKIDGYGNVYELLYVDGISQKELSELLEFVTVGQ